MLHDSRSCQVGVAIPIPEGIIVQRILLLLPHALHTVSRSILLLASYSKLLPHGTDGSYACFKSRIFGVFFYWIHLPILLCLIWLDCRFAYCMLHWSRPLLAHCRLTVRMRKRELLIIKGLITLYNNNYNTTFKVLLVNFLGVDGHTRYRKTIIATIAT